MVLETLFQPLPSDFPNRLNAGKDGVARVPASRPLLLLALVLLCLLPRAAMAWKMGGICPDAVFYIQLAESLDEGRFHDALERINLNIFPVILVLLQQTGLSWELAGKLWGVAISTCTVLPLYGWTRRQFDDRVALVACLLYALHSELIRWSPEVIRDPTFWFLFTLSLYLLWRAVTEVRLGLFAAAGVAMVLASLTRFEGWLLVVPLALWSFWRWRASAEVRKRLLAGALLCAGLVVMARMTWIGDHSPAALFRKDPLVVAERWAEGLVQPMTGADASGAEAPIATGNSPARMVQLYVSALVKGFTPVFSLLALAGFVRWRRLWKRCDHQATFWMTLLIGLAIWIHLDAAQASCKRYFFPVVIMTCPLAALGLLECSAGLLRFAKRRAWSGGLRGLVAASPAILAGAVTLGVLAASDCRFRQAEVELGHWMRQQFGPVPVLLGPDAIAHVVNYYAQGACESFPRGTSEDFVAVRTEQLRPHVVLWPVEMGTSEHGQDLLRRVEGLGFAEVDRAQFCGGCRKVRILARKQPNDCKWQMADCKWQIEGSNFRPDGHPNP
jgi:hypothetical protein